FNSFHFLWFYGIVTVLFFSIPSIYRNLLLLLSSYFFYMIWEPAYGFLIAFSTAISFYTALAISKRPFHKRKKGIAVCLIINLSILFFFKYFNFFNWNFRFIFNYFGFNYPIPDLLEIVLPVGISFYTFETISYILDVYYDRRPPEKNFGTYALYISFFPKLLAGPIEKSTSLLVQLNTKTTFNSSRIIEGLRRMLWGFFKKIVIADRLSQLINPVYAHPEDHSGIFVLLSCYLFAFQIYCDFSGYTDIAIGTSKVLGYDIVENFEHPYISKNVGEFWRRWHLSLSNWLRDYLFTPIVFKRKNWGNYSLIYATFITFILCGLWHGAKWTFIIFGFLQGVVISFELLTKKTRKKWSEILPEKAYNLLSILLTFHFIVFCFIFFRAESVNNAIQILERISHLSFNTGFISEFSKFGILGVVIVAFSLLFMFFIEYKYKPTLEGLNDNRLNYTFNIFTFACLLILGYFHPQIFIYFNF
ncbi:MAG TPA: MBOAT family O-acyltransferase, partial [Bacteroidia bacterium]|nr:MBOAT family O-acyltransferase [Bacteroidia bacterium]